MSVEATATAGGSRILVIEDERKMARLVARALSAVGFKVVTAAGGEEGLDLLRARPFELGPVGRGRTRP